MISQTAEYALRAVLFLGRQSEVPFTTQQIARVTRMPPGYLSKVLQALGRAELVQSQRGLHGGFVLTRSPRDVTLLDVVNAVDPLRRVECCPIGAEGHDVELCPLHRRLDEAVETVQSLFGGITIQGILDEEAERNLVSGCVELPTEEP